MSIFDNPSPALQVWIDSHPMKEPSSLTDMMDDDSSEKSYRDEMNERAYDRATLDLFEPTHQPQNVF